MADPVSQTITQTNIPEYAKPYVESMLGATQQQLFDTTPNAAGGYDITGVKPYQPYSTDPSQYFAGFSPMQQQSFQGAAGMQPSQQVTDASNMAAQAGVGGLNIQYGGQQFGNAYQGIPMYNPGQFNQQQIQAPSLSMYQMGGPQNVRTQQFTGNQVGQYMNPYLQNALNPQIAELNRAYDITGSQARGQATQAGAFGGSRQALMQAENERNRNMGIANLLGQGYNTAYNQAANQFNAQQQANLQAQLANQQAGLTTGQTNLQAALGVQYLGAGQYLAAQQANQQMNLATQQAQQQANQFGYGQLANQAQNLAQYGQAANQLNAQQQQFGANLGLQGLQTGLSAAGQLGQLGQTQYGQQMGILGLQNQLGGQQQAQQQNIINQAVQNYAMGQQYPQQQLAFMNSMLRGLPLQTATTSAYQAAPSTVSQIGGLGTAGIAGLGLYNTMNKAG